MLKTLAAAAVLLCLSMAVVIAEPQSGQADSQKSKTITESTKPAESNQSAASDSSDLTDDNPPIEVNLGIPEESKDKAAEDTSKPDTSDKSPILTPTPTDKQKAQSARQSRLSKEALSYRGTRYVWGGDSTDGFDCSGFTEYLYARTGIKLPHSAKMQFSKGTPVEKADLQEGDLVFFNTRGPITHVGMYIGNGKFIHAANRRRGVTVNSLDEPYYTNRYAGARRYSTTKKILRPM